eukprot:463656-Rhodomonas_salina.3
MSGGTCCSRACISGRSRQSWAASVRLSCSGSSSSVCARYDPRCTMSPATAQSSSRVNKSHTSGRVGGIAAPRPGTPKIVPRRRAVSGLMIWKKKEKKRQMVVSGSATRAVFVVLCGTGQRRAGSGRRRGERRNADIRIVSGRLSW